MSFRSEPMLWIHLSGLATTPLSLGLVIGKLIVAEWLEVAIVLCTGLPVLWMRWQRPFYIFAILAIALKHERLTHEQLCQILSLIHTRDRKILAGVTAVLLVAVLLQLYQMSPALAVSMLSPQWRILGLSVAALTFALSNLFCHPVSVARVLVTSDAEFAATPPYPQERIAPDFTTLGLQVNRILPTADINTNN